MDPVGGSSPCPRCATALPRAGWAGCPACGWHGQAGTPTAVAPASAERTRRAGPTAAAVLIGTFAALVLLAAGTVLLGRRSTPPGPSAAARSGSPVTATTARDQGTGTGTEGTDRSGRCGDIPPVTPISASGHPDALMEATMRGDVDVSALAPVYGTVRSVFGYHVTEVDDFMGHLATDDRDGRRAALVRNGFVEAAQRDWVSNRSDSITLLVVRLGGSDQAVAYAGTHLADVCRTSSPIVPSTVVPGAVTYFGKPTAGKQTARLIAVVGDTEVNITMCTCRPGDTAMEAGERWAASLVNELASARA